MFPVFSGRLTVSLVLVIVLVLGLSLIVQPLRANDHEAGLSSAAIKT